MKRFIYILTLGMAMCFTSCYDDTALWDSVNDHEARIAQLETLCNQMNTNISSLQTILEALQKNDSVTGVLPVLENGKEVGYTITFAKSGPVTIYHGRDGKDGIDGSDGKDGMDGKDGTDGKDGADGTNGITPVIGVSKDTDGIYYWTLNGEWILDDAGEKIKAVGEDGKDGSVGEDGTNGKDGITPQLKIEDGCWYLSYDKGISWQKLGVAGETSSCIFKDVTYDNGVLTMVFADGEVLSVPVGQTFSIILGEYKSNVGDEFEIPYTIQGAKGAVTVYVLSSDQQWFDVDWIEESPTTGKIKVTH